MNVPAELRYTKTHEWVRLEGDTVTIGITDHAQSELGDIVFVDLPTPGRSLGQDESFGSVESVKTVSDVYAPVAGEVVEVNEALGGQSELLNAAPYEAGWLIKVKVSDPAAVDSLLSAADYQALLDA